MKNINKCIILELKVKIKLFFCAKYEYIPTINIWVAFGVSKIYQLSWLSAFWNDIHHTGVFTEQSTYVSVVKINFFMSSSKFLLV